MTATANPVGGSASIGKALFGSTTFASNDAAARATAGVPATEAPPSYLTIGNVRDRAWEVGYHRPRERPLH